ncbi:putative nuclease HARBI1 [Ictalurus furcatus]|uniref:putative nuclease HARBI1 n=1 Tax=Ictalurus furcatus TaxID=66913 RepID=UPI002350D851|nr:putative nuclease HARBI1 [Ictalurus furcatus]XP_053482513.1 putative nuclease HARBI1 [Ictalurus furcatus]XP_053482514.1 putative nuclease HARBI1 [Ictalurus furcatus]
MEYMYFLRRRRYKERVYRRWSSFLGLTEEECQEKLHLSSGMVLEICRLVADDVANPSGPSALPVAVKVTAALAFFANGSFQNTLGLVTGVSQSAISCAIHVVSSSLVRHAADYIVFPASSESQLRTKQDFMSKYGLPGVLGSIDCTHVQLRAPSTEPLSYVNRLGVYSINIQVVCDANCLVTHVYANYPGSSHDSFILANSVIPTVFQRGSLDGWLIGDDGYPLKPWLLTPYVTPTTRKQHVFNSVLNRARSVIERTFGMLKMRFKCLDRSGGTLQYSPKNVSAFFVACCVLHNIATHHGCHFDLTEEALQDLRKREAELHEPCEETGEQLTEAWEGRDKLAAQLVLQVNEAPQED